MPRLLRPLAAAGLLSLAFQAPAAENYGSRADVRQFISEMVEKHGFVRRELNSLFSRARYQPGIIRAMSLPAESPQRSWGGYRATFVNRERIEAGIRFHELHAETLARASALYGVPAHIIVAIIGIETVYGRNLGAFRVIDALATLAFDYPPRAEFFRSELESYLLYARETGIDVLNLKGSYAGAIGLPQFMPGSYRRFAVDFDGDGRRDLSGSAADAIGSIANFLREHGWKRGQPIALPARVTGERFRPLVQAGIKPSYFVGNLEAFGVMLDQAPAPDLACALVELETPGSAPEYWVGLENFYALTRYNHSSYYAISVVELAREIAASQKHGPTLDRTIR